MVYNKIDLYRERYFDDLLTAQERIDIESELRERLLTTFGENVFISAYTKEGIDELKGTYDTAELRDICGAVSASGEGVLIWLVELLSC